MDILQIWEGLDTGANTSTNQLVKLAIHILTIVANSAGAERFFSLLGIIHTSLDSTSIHNAATLTMETRLEHISSHQTRANLNMAKMNQTPLLWA